MHNLMRKSVLRAVVQCFAQQHARLLSSVIPTSRSKPEGISLNVPIQDLQPNVASYVEAAASLCRPSKIHICDGSEKENNYILNVMTEAGIIEKISKLKNCYLATTDPADVARVESKTYVVTDKKHDTVPRIDEGVKGSLGNWMEPKELQNIVDSKFSGCMAGRTMYVIPFSMGPVGSSMSKIGVQCTDSPYVVASMRIMTRMGKSVLDTLGNDSFVKCLHTVGVPLPTNRKIKNNWPCNPEETIIAHVPDTNEILSYGSGYGGNSLLGKKCFALRIGSTIARREGWLAEHMLILGITNPAGVKRYIAAAFPSACGKTNLAMMTPSLPGYKVECVGDDIAWMKFDDKGVLRAINPENGFFGVAPGTSMKTNPIAMMTIESNTIYTNVAKSSDGGVFWEGMEKEVDKNAQITSWTGVSNWTKESGTAAAHPNSRFCTPASQCPIIDPQWENPEGVPISCILFGGRRPAGIPLVYEAFNWKHGVLLGAAMRSETTAAAEHKGKVIMNDPFAMRPFFGYNFGHYLQHWLEVGAVPNRSLPKIFHVNWFRKDSNGKFIWPGFGENIRVLDWILRRMDDEKDIAVETPIGYVPKYGSINLKGLEGENIDMEELFRLPKSFWEQEVLDIRKYFKEQVGSDIPNEILEELSDLESRLQKF